VIGSFCGVLGLIIVGIGKRGFFMLGRAKVSGAGQVAGVRERGVQEVFFLVKSFV